MTSAFSDALVTGGDIEVMPGLYKLGGPNVGNIIFPPSNKNIRCCTDAGANCSSTTANYNAGGGTVAFANTTRPAASTYFMFAYHDAHNDSIYGCQFRGFNYGATQPANEVNNVTNDTMIFVQMDSVSAANLTHDITIVQNDFNGPTGNIGTIDIVENSTAAEPPPHDILIAYNTFELCGYRGVEITNAYNVTVTNSTTSDCVDAVEDNVGTERNNTIKNGLYRFPHGSGLAIGDPSYNYLGDELTGGQGPLDYTNIIELNTVGITGQSGLGAIGEFSKAKFFSNTPGPNTIRVNPPGYNCLGAACSPPNGSTCTDPVAGNCSNE